MALDVDEDRGVVDENIDAAERLDGFGRHAVCVLFFRHVDLQRERFAAFGANLGCNGLAVENIGDHHRRAFRDEFAAIGRADVTRTAGNDGNSARQPHRPLRSNRVTEWWSDGSGTLNPVRSNTPSGAMTFHRSPFRCSRKSTGFHHVFRPKVSAITFAAL